MGRGAWKAAVHGVAKSLTQLSDFIFTFHFHALEKEMATHSSVLAWRIPGTGSLGGCRLCGRTELGTTEATQQQQQRQDCVGFFMLWAYFELVIYSSPEVVSHMNCFQGNPLFWNLCFFNLGAVCFICYIKFLLDLVILF